MAVFCILKVIQVVLKHNADTQWSSMFMFDSIFETGYFISMIVVMFILRPTNETCRETFSYFEEINNEDTVTDMDQSPVEVDHETRKKRVKDPEIELESMDAHAEEIGKDL